MIATELLFLIRRQFALDLDGIHGLAHWERVRDNGLRLAEATGADAQVVELFAYLHDVKRWSNGRDREHGWRAAEFIKTLPATLVPLRPRELGLLLFACERHSAGLTEGDITVQTCWDADRLDLGRIGVEPTPQRLCTAAAQDRAMIEWAYLRSL